MSDRLFKLPYQVVASKAFLLWISGAWIIYYVLQAIWVKEAFGGFVTGLRASLLFQIPFVLFFVSGSLNVIRVSRDIFKRSKMECAVWLILPVGALLFFTGFFLSITLRESAQKVVGEGNIISPPWVSESYRLVSIDPGLKDRITDFDVYKGIFAYEPKVTVIDSSARAVKIGAFPPEKIEDTYYHILNFGLAPGLRLFEGSQLKEEGHMALNILVPGSSDFFEISPLPYRFIISLEPEKTLLKKQKQVFEFNLKDPVFYVKAFKGEKVVAEGNSIDGINVGDYTVRFIKPAFWVLLEAVKDPGISVMHAGIVLLTIGIPMSVMRYAFLLLRNRAKKR